MNTLLTDYVVKVDSVSGT